MHFKKEQSETLRLDSYKRKLDILYSDTEQIKDEMTQSYLAKYLCIRTSGYIENVLKTLIENYCDGTTPKQINNFVTKKIRFSTNLDYNRIYKILSEFSLDWSTEFSESISDKQKSSLNSVVSNRNNIAHGNPDSISFLKIREYYEDIIEIAATLKDIIKK